MASVDPSRPFISTGHLPDAETITALTKLAANPDNNWAAPAAFNLGNAQYQLG